jgi:hypothetical protein
MMILLLKGMEQKKREKKMTPKRIDVSIICSICNKPVNRREMVHDLPGGVYRYYVECHGAKDFGDHLTVTADDNAHGAVLEAFPTNPSVEMKGRGTTIGGAAPEPTHIDSKQ